MSDSDSPPKLSSVKTKKRRRRSERNKLKLNSSSKNTSSNKGDIDKHVLKAHNVRKEMEAGQSKIKYSSLTSNRITAQLGLFNRGKKSSAIGRAPIKIPDSVKEKTREDLKKIINISDDDLESHERRQSWIKDKDNDMSFSIGPDYSLTLTSGSEPNSCSVTCSSVRSLAQRQGATPSSVSCTSTPCGSVTEDFPQSPPLDTIAKTLLLELKPSRWFPGSSFLQDLQDELNKLMKQNSSSHVNITPMRRTPGSINTVIVKRSLLKSLVSVDDISGCAVVEKSKRAEAMEIDPSSESQSQRSSKGDPQTKLTNSSLITDVNQFFDAQSLLSHNDCLIASRSTEDSGSERMATVSTSGDQFPQHMVTSDMLTSLNEERVSQSTSLSSLYYSHSFHPAMSHGPTREHPTSSAPQSSVLENPTPKQAVITKLNEHPEYMPKFHGNYYRKGVDEWADFSRGPPLQDATMDLLEMVDRSQPALNHLTSSHPDGNRCARRGTSPLHLPPSNILPLKPSLDTPSPPEKLYPRRLY